jgi:hypothetical protein
MSLRVERSDGEMRIEVGDPFLVEHASRLCDLLSALDAGARVAIDFGRVRDCDDVALAVLARQVLGGRARVVLRGTSQHQERLLRYLGVPAGPPPRDAG